MTQCYLSAVCLVAVTSPVVIPSAPYQKPQPWPRTERKVRRHRPVLDRVLYRAQLSPTALIP